MSQPPPPTPSDDPTFLHSRREAIAILVLWAVCLVWTIGYCRVHAYDLQEGEISLVLGLPGWVFWGVAVPWAIAALVSILFAVYFVAEDDLGEDVAEHNPSGEVGDA